jgi:Tfp pilus assembly protein PilO
VALRLSKRESRMLLVLVAIVALYLLYSQLHMPLNAELAALNSQIEASRLKADTMRRTAVSLSALENELADLHRRLDAIWKGVADEPDVPSLIRSLERCSVQSGATLTNFRPLPVVVARYVAEMPFELILEGSFASVVDFLRRAEEESPAVVFTAVRINVSRSDTFSSAPQLNAVVSGKTYYRTNSQAVRAGGGA